MAALTVSAFVALSTSHSSLAGEVAADASGAVPAHISSDIALPASDAKDAAITFAPAHEVVQPLSNPAIEANQEISAPTLAALVSSRSSDADLDDEARCLAGAVYFESKGESLSGQLAVARVVINRARSGRFASSLCGVVYQPGQFSFVRGRSIPAINTTSRDWHKAVAITQIALDNSWSNPAEGALFFHARRVSPGWRLTRVAAIDNHIFYR